MSAVYILCVSILAAIWRFVLVPHPLLFLKLTSSQPRLELMFKTNDLASADVVVAIALMVIKSIKTALGYGPRLRRRGSARSKDSRGTSPAASQPSIKSKQNSVEPFDFDLPNLQIKMPLDVRIEDVKQYLLAADILGSSAIYNSSGEKLTQLLTINNGHLLLFLSAITEPALLLLLARSETPVSPLGAVNVRNHFKITDLAMCKQVVNELFRTEVATMGQGTARALKVVANLHDARRVKRGVEIDVRVALILEGKRGETISENNGVIFEQIFTVLDTSQKGTSRRHQEQSQSNTSGVSLAGVKKSEGLTNVPRSELRQPPQLVSYIKLTLKSPLLWARLCKDYNPIHTSSAAAQAFGFKTAIAHGNHVVAKAVQILSGAGDEGFQNFCEGKARKSNGILWMEVRFKRPVFLPAEVGARFVNDVGTIDRGVKHDENLLRVVEVFKADKVNVEVFAGIQI